MRGTLVTKTWQWDPTLYAPPRYRKAREYEAFVPDPLTGREFDLASGVTGVVSDAEQAIMTLNTGAGPALAPLARLLLRTESIASSKVEGMRVGIRQLARAESRMETGGKASSAILEVLGNIDAMRLAVDEAATAERIGVSHVVDVHRELMANAPNSDIAGVVRTNQNWIGGNDYNPCGADFVPPPREYVDPLLHDLCEAMASDSFPPLVQAAIGRRGVGSDWSPTRTSGDHRTGCGGCDGASQGRDPPGREATLGLWRTRAAIGVEAESLMGGRGASRTSGGLGVRDGTWNDFDRYGRATR